MKANLPFVRVEWMDTHADSKWFSLEKLIKPVKVYSFGFLVEDKENYVCLAASIIPSDMTVGELTAIPRGCIKEIVTIKSKFCLLP